MIKIFKFVSVLGFSLFFLSGCGLKVTDYNVSADNNVKLREMKNVKIAVDSFTAKTKDESHILCRLAETISTPQGEPFEKYIEKALVSELKMAGIYDKDSKLKIKGHLEKVVGSSMLGNAYWQFDIVVSSSNGKSINVSTKREYPSSFVAYTACNNMATSFQPTIKKLIGDIISHKDFSSLLM